MNKNYINLNKVYKNNSNYPLTIIFGEVGAGKTALMTYFAITNIICGRERYLECVNSIKNLNSLGFNFQYPFLEHTTASNYYVNSVCEFSSGIESYVVNPYKLALPNKDIQYMTFPPYFNFYITESQSHLNSRKSLYFRSCVSRLYENCRHNHWTITLDCQRPNLLDMNVREITNRFIKVVKMVNKFDKVGNLIKSTWYTLEFTDFASCNHFIETHETQGGQYKKYVFIGNIFACYNSYENQMAFYDIPKDKPLDLLNWSSIDTKFLIVPENYYERKGR